MSTFRSDGHCLQELFEYGYDDIEFCRSPGEAYARAYLLNGGIADC
jgi:hypothetical protein